MRIDIKDFIPMSKFTIVEGIFKKVERNLESKELEFYNIDKDTLAKLIKKENTDTEDNTKFLYTIIPVLSNIDMTIDFEEFNKLCQFPSLQFASYIDLLMEHIKELFATAVTLNNINEKVNGFAKENGIEISEVKARSKEDIEAEIDKLYENLSIDKANRKTIQAQIDALEKELVEMEVENND